MVIDGGMQPTYINKLITYTGTYTHKH